MKQYLLTIYQPDGPPPPPEVLGPIMRDVGVVVASMKAEGVWVFNGGLHPPDTATVLRLNGGDLLTTDGPLHGRQGAHRRLRRDQGPRSRRGAGMGAQARGGAAAADRSAAVSGRGLA